MVRAAYDGIYRDLKQQIESGAYAYQELLPSQSMLVKRYRCAHNTVRKALSMLADEGYCQPIHGKGVRVIWRARGERRTLAMGGIQSFVQAARRSGFEGKTNVVVFDRLVCDEALSERTSFPVGVKLVHVERVRLLDGRPVIHDVSYYLASAVEGLTQEDAKSSIYEYAERELGTKITTCQRVITMEHATADDRLLLDLEGVDYVACVANHAFDGNANLFEYTESHRHPDYFCITTTEKRAK